MSQGLSVRNRRMEGGGGEPLSLDTRAHCAGLHCDVLQDGHGFADIVAWCVCVALKQFLYGCFQRASCRCGAAPNTDGRILSPGEDRLVCIARKRLALHVHRGSLLGWPQDVLWRIQPDLIIELGSSRGGGDGGGGAFFYATVMQFYNPTGKVLSIGPRDVSSGAAKRTVRTACRRTRRRCGGAA